ALAAYGNVDVAEIEEVWHGASPPYEALFRWLEGRGERPEPSTAAMFRPLMLSHPIEDREFDELDPPSFAAEAESDGLRVQVSANGFETRLFSRSGDDISSAFPDILESFAAFRGVADGELLVLKGGIVQPFNDLQQRLNRKTVSPKLVDEHPAHI